MSSERNKTAISSRVTWLLTFVTPYRNQIVGLLLISVLASSLVLVQPMLTKGIIDEGILAGDFPQLVSFALILLLVGLLSTLISGVSRYFHTLVSAKVLFALRNNVYQHLQSLSPSFYARQRRGDIMSRIDGDVAELQRFTVDGIFAAFSGLFGLVGSVGLLWYLSWKLTLIALILLPLEWYFLYKMRPKVERAVRRVREKSADLSAFFIENISIMKLIQNMGGEKREMTRLSALNKNYLNNLINLQLVEFASHAVPSTLTSWSRAAIFMWGGYWVINGSMELGSLIAFSSYLGMAVGPINTLLGLYLSLGRVKVSLERVDDIIQSPRDIHQTEEELNYQHSSNSFDSKMIDREIDGTLHLHKLSFRYPDTTQCVFVDANLSLPAGSAVVFQSPSGTGKSTLIDLLMRHYDPQAGCIMAGGVDIRQIPLSQWRKQFAVVDQHTALFRASLADNVRYGNPKASDEEVTRALEQAQLTELVASLDNGMHSLLGENGLNLSGGQRQRIALARALLQQPQFLILDEATSALDAQTETAVLSAINSRFRHCTRIYISHRAQVLEDCDFLLSIKDNALVLETS